MWPFKKRTDDELELAKIINNAKKELQRAKKLFKKYPISHEAWKAVQEALRLISKESAQFESWNLTKKDLLLGEIKRLVRDIQKILEMGKLYKQYYESYNTAPVSSLDLDKIRERLYSAINYTKEILRIL